MPHPLCIGILANLLGVVFAVLRRRPSAVLPRLGPVPDIRGRPTEHFFDGPDKVLVPVLGAHSLRRHPVPRQLARSGKQRASGEPLRAARSDHPREVRAVLAKRDKAADTAPRHLAALGQGKVQVKTENTRINLIACTYSPYLLGPLHNYIFLTAASS